MAATTDPTSEKQQPVSTETKSEEPPTFTEKDAAPPATAQDEAGAACDYDPSGDFKGDLQVSQALPTNDEVAKCADMLVLGADGESRPFRSLYSGEGVASRQLIIFVRHFFCGVRPATSPPLHAAKLTLQRNP